MSLVKIIENTFFANGRYWGSLNRSLFVSGPVWAMNTGIESADLNMVWNEKPLTAKDNKAISIIKENYRNAGLPFWWWVFPCAQSQTTSDILKNEGFSLVDNIPSMVADLTVLPDEEIHNVDVQIIQIENRENLFLWEDVSFRGFEFPPAIRLQYTKFVNTFNIRPDSPQKLFLAFFQGEPVANSLLFCHENAGGIYFVSTLPAYRKKSIGLAITLATMQFARKTGAQYCTLQSSADGFRVYQQAGFKEYCRVAVYGLKNQQSIN